jgi:hypothetical protein
MVPFLLALAPLVARLFGTPSAYFGGHWRHHTRYPYSGRLAVLAPQRLAVVILSWASWQTPRAKLRSPKQDELPVLLLQLHRFHNQANRFVSAFERLYDPIAFDIMTLLIKAVVSFVIMLTFAPMWLWLMAFFIVYVEPAVWMAMRKWALRPRPPARVSLVAG